MDIDSKIGPSIDGTYLTELPGAFGELRRSDDVQDDVDALRERMVGDGYLYLPGLLDTTRVAAARDAMLEQLDRLGCLDPAARRVEGQVRSGKPAVNTVAIANGVPEVFQLLYEAEMMSFWARFLGDSVRHFDFTWFRNGTAGRNTPPHCDTVYMGRGTPDLYTTWTPLMDVPYELGGLMILENSHTREDLLADYWTNDVDTYCETKPTAAENAANLPAWRADKSAGIFDPDTIKLQSRFKQRWLSTEFQAGDILTFGMHTLHASADNHTSRFRLSTDSRYQLASEPADERWIGAAPVGHGANAKKGMIC
ncbi:MAG TPA: phytanoyl-CoA dioxygenase [Lentisphaeria bacterium]|nr:phytanoyl-CoA dioxygenase [Lentisphaeria bacterium]